MLIENDNHFHTLYLVVRLSALYKKTWILIRLRHSNILYITLYHKYLTKVLHNACGKPVENSARSVENSMECMETDGCSIYYTHL